MIQHNPEACVACGLCAYVCAGGAIKLQETEDEKAIDFVVWHNSCTFCGLCEFYCPTKAIHLTNDYHTAHLQADKFSFAERTRVKKQPCIRCGVPIIPLSPKMAEKIYGKDGDVKNLMKMCPECRRKNVSNLWKDAVLK
jgi:ferredoxin